MKLVGDVENLEDRRSYRVQILPGCVRDFFYTLNAKADQPRPASEASGSEDLCQAAC